MPNAGVKPGDVFRITSGVGTVAGVSFAGDFTVSDCRNSYFEMTLPGAASGATNATYTARYSFLEGAPTEILLGASAQDLGTFILANTSLVTLPNLVHSFAARRVSSVDSIYIGISSGNTDALLKLGNIFRPASSRTFGYMRQLPSAGPDLSEPTVCTDGTSLFGFLRHQASPDTVSALFWWSDDDGSTFTSYPLPSGRAVSYLSPIAVRVYGNYLIAVLTGDRMPEMVGGTSVPLYFMISDRTAAKTTSWTSWRSYMCGTIPRTPSASSGAGVPSLAISGKKAFLFFGQEEFPQGNSNTAQGTIANLFCLTLDLGFLDGGSGFGDLIGPSAMAPARMASVEFDRGEMPNGDKWVRYSDGTQKCYSRALASGVTSGATGNLFASANIVWTFPVAFIESPTVYGSSRRTAGSGMGWPGNQDLGASPTNYQFRVLATANDHQANCYMIAEGKWF